MSPSCGIIGEKKTVVLSNYKVTCNIQALGHQHKASSYILPPGRIHNPQQIHLDTQSHGRTSLDPVAENEPFFWMVYQERYKLIQRMLLSIQDVQ